MHRDTLLRIAADNNLSPNERLVYAVMVELCTKSKDGWVMMTGKEMGRRIAASPKVTAFALRCLCDYEYLQREMCRIETDWLNFDFDNDPIPGTVCYRYRLLSQEKPNQ